MKELNLTVSAWIIIVVFATLVVIANIPFAIVLLPLLACGYITYRLVVAYRAGEVGKDRPVSHLSFWSIVATITAVVVWCVLLIVSMFTEK